MKTEEYAEMAAFPEDDCVREINGRSEKHRPAAIEPGRECMKKRTTIVLSLLMTASLLMTTGCGSSESTASDKTAESGAAEEKAETAESSSAEVTAPADDESSAEASTEKADDENKTPEILSLTRTRDYSLGRYSDDNVFLVSSHYDILDTDMSSDDLPEHLKDVLDSYNKEIKTSTSEQADECYEYAKSDYDYKRDDYISQSGESNPDSYEFWNCYAAENDTTVVRADNEILSLMVMNYWNAGGAHPSTSYSAYNYDMATGKTLELDDVFTDTGKLAGILSDLIYKAYPDVTFFADDDMSGEGETLEGDIQNMIDEPETYGGLVFTLDYSGANFTFSQYSLAAYVYGIQTVTLSYDEYADMFAKDYSMAPENYIEKIDSGTDYQIEADDGSTKVLRIDYEYSGDEETDSFVTADITFGKATATAGKDDYAFKMEPYLVHNDGKLYLWIDYSMESDYHNIHIWNLNTDNDDASLEELDSMPYGLSDRVPLDPQNIELSTICQLGSTTTIFGDFKVGSDGNLKMDGKYFAMQPIRGDGVTLNKDVDVETESADYIESEYGAVVNYSVGTGPVYNEDGSVKQMDDGSYDYDQCEKSGSFDEVNEVPDDKFEKATVKKETKLYLYRTDGGRIVDFTTDSGDIVRITFDEDSTSTFNGGIDSFTTLEDAAYAG